MNIQTIVNYILNEKELPDSVYLLRARHYKEEKDTIAEHFSEKVLGPRIKYLMKNSKIPKIQVIFDSGTTIAPILEVIGRKAEKNKNYWCKDISVITNNIKGIENMLRYREHRDDRYAQLSVNQFSVLPGKVLAAFEAIADEETLDALEACRNDGNYTIAVTTGNYILLHNGQFVEIARAGYHPDFKATLIDIADEVYVIAPLGKLLMWNTEVRGRDRVGSLKEMLIRLNKDLKLIKTPRHQFGANTAYNLVTNQLVWSRNKSNHLTKSAKRDKDGGIGAWLKKSVLITTSRDDHCLFCRHFRHVEAQFSCKFNPDWIVGQGPTISTIPFSSLPISPKGQFETEIPHKNFRSCAESYFFLTDQVNQCR